MPLVHGVRMRWSVRKDPCFVCKKIDHEKYMVEVERQVLLCPDCVESYRERFRDGKSKASRRPVVDGS